MRWVTPERQRERETPSTKSKVPPLQAARQMLKTENCNQYFYTYLFLFYVYLLHVCFFIFLSFYQFKYFINLSFFFLSLNVYLNHISFIKASFNYICILHFGTLLFIAFFFYRHRLLRYSCLKINILKTIF